MQEYIEIIRYLMELPEDIKIEIILGNPNKKLATAKIDDGKLLANLYFKDNIPIVEVYEYKETKIGIAKE